MRQIVTTKNGDVEVLQVQEAPDPVAAKGEVVVRVKAAGLNFADILARQGFYPDGPSKPCVMGYEVAGMIESMAKVSIERCLAKPWWHDALQRTSGKGDGWSKSALRET